MEIVMVLLALCLCGCPQHDCCVLGRRIRSFVFVTAVGEEMEDAEMKFRAGTALSMALS